LIIAGTACIITGMTTAGRRKFPALLILLSILLLAVIGCGSVEKQALEADSSSESQGGEMTFSAEVRWIPLEGGFYGLVAEDGRRFLPLNLPEEFEQDGLEVWVRGKPSDTATIRMWGTPFEIYEMKIRGAQ